jgi:hypothetical protein
MNAYEPDVGDLVYDETTRKVGEVVDHVGPYWQLKPPGGGREWDAQGPLRPYAGGATVLRRRPRQRDEQG